MTDNVMEGQTRQLGPMCRMPQKTNKNVTKVQGKRKKETQENMERRDERRSEEKRSTMGNI